MKSARGVVVGVVLTASAEAAAAPTVAAEVMLPGAPFDGVAAAPDGSRVYVSLVMQQGPGKNGIAVIDAATHAVTGVIDLGDQGADSSSARQLYMAPDGGLLVHATYADNLIVIDTATDQVKHTLPGVGNATAVFTPDSQRLWSRDGATKTLQVYDTGDMSLIKTFPLLSPGSSDFPLEMAPDGGRVHAATSNDGGNGFPEPIAIDSYDAAALTLTNHYGVGAGFQANALVDARISPDGGFLYVSAANSTKVVRVDLTAGAVTGSGDVPQGNEGLSLSPDGETLYLFENGYSTGLMRVYAAETMQLLKSVDVKGQTARFIATSRRSVFAPNGCAAIVPAPLVNAIFAVDTATHDKIATFPTPGGMAYTVEFSPDSTQAYVTVRTAATSGRLVVLDMGPECVTAPGEPCAADAECGELQCVDGVCCDSACGDGDPGDCQACSVTNGGAVDGVCGPVGATTCRPAVGECDLEEACDGAALECPADEFVADGEACSEGVCAGGACVPEEGSSTGTSGEPGTSGETGGSSGGVIETTGSTGGSTSGGETGEAPTSSGAPGSASDSDSASGGVDLTTGTGGAAPTTSGDASSGGDASGSDSAGETIDDGCGCRADGGRGLAVLLLPGLVCTRRRRRTDQA